MNKRNELMSYSFTEYTDLIYRYESMKSEIANCNWSFLQKVKAGISCCAHTCYDILLFFCSPENKKGQGIYVELYKIDMKEFSLFDWSLNDGIEPVLYDDCRLWLISECSYWYAVEYAQKYYAFDIREICSKTGIPKPGEDLNIKDKHIWLSKFVEQLENSRYFLDIKNLSIDNYFFLK